MEVTDLSRQQLIKQLMDDFNGDRIQFSSPEYALVCLPSRAKLLKN